MKGQRKKRIVAMLTSVMLFSISITSVGIAADHYKNLRVWQGDLKVVVNGKQIQLQDKPFLYNGKTYLPLRELGEKVFDKTVGWDGVNYIATLTDKPNVKLSYLEQELIRKEITINELKSQVSKLEEKLEKKKDETKDLDELEDYLNKKHDTYNRITFDIRLSEKKSDIQVDIYVDLDEYSSKWNKLSDSDIKEYLQEIVDEIVKEWDDVTISGAIIDDSRRSSKELISFSVSSRDKVRLDKVSNNRSNLSDLEKYINKHYDRFGKADVRFRLDWSRSYIRLGVIIDRDKWDEFSKSDKKSYLQDIYREIDYDFPEEEVEGYIEDDDSGKVIDEFEIDSRGNVYFR